MRRVLKPRAKAAIIIGTEYIAILNDQIIQQIAEENSFKTITTIKRELQKITTGNIREESIIILEK